MVDLFRYIEHQFAVPARTDAIDVANQSDFQTALHAAAVGDEPYTAVRRLAEEFLSTTFPSPTDDRLARGADYRDFAAGLRALNPMTASSGVAGVVASWGTCWVVSSWW